MSDEKPMTLSEVLDEIEDDAHEAAVRANNRVVNTLRSCGWASRDDSANLIWVHERVQGQVDVRRAVDIQCAWDAAKALARAQATP